MIELLKTNRIFLLLLFFIVIGAILRFYNLNWGAPYYFHPDERNIASAITQLTFPSQMNPHFFAYGSLPLYSVYFIGTFLNYILHFFNQQHLSSVSFEQAIIIGRCISAILSTALIPLLYITGKKLYGKTTGLFAAFLGTTSIGLIQYAHFSTFEIWLTFWGVVLFYLSLVSLQTYTNKILIALACTFGILCAIKISSIILIIPIFSLFMYRAFHERKSFFTTIKNGLVSCIIVLSFAFLIFIITNPFVFLSPYEFLASMQYEGAVVLKTLPVFYTQGFIDTTPIIFQFHSIYPFLLNPFILGLFLMSFLFVFFLCIKNKSFSLFLLLFFFLILFLSQSFFFAKWTRYMIPTLPFIYLIIAYTLATIISYLYKKHVHKSIMYVGFIFLITICSFYSFLFLYVVYFQSDSRITAMQWATTNIDTNSTIISEVYDLGIVPFNQHFSSINLINFYDLEIDISEQQRLEDLKNSAEIIILPSQRIIKTRLKHPQIFPKGYPFYQRLSQENSYKKIYQTPCTILCKIVYGGDPLFSLEETTSVFDRPVISIYKKL